jgi:hypothetical protein
MSAGADLVVGSPTRVLRLDQHAQYRQVAVYGRLSEAEVARGVLEADGIPAALLDTQMAGLGLGPAVGGVRLLVPGWAEARAVELLAPPVAGPLEGLAPLPGTLATVTPPAPAVSPPATPAPGPLALRIAVGVGLALLATILLALR